VIDLLVVGGGPAGLVTALHADRAGLRTIVVEPRPTPVDKACGEGLMPAAVRALAELGVDPPGQPFRGIRYTDGRRSAVADFRDGLGRGVRRTALHQALHSAVLAAGIEIRAGRVDQVDQGNESVTAAGLGARYLVAADGLHSPVRRRLGLERPGPRHRRWGMRAHFAVPPWTDRVEVHWSEHTEAYVTPVGPDCVGVAVLGGIQAPFGELLAAFPHLVARLPAEPVTGVRAAGPLRQRVSRRVAGRVLLVGDAAGYVDALTGEGLAMSFACARALVDRVAAGEPERYERDYRAITRNYRVLTTALVRASAVPTVRRALVPTAARVPALFRAAVNQVAG
jgi:flavin-dependent dehydrogenase